MISRKNHRLLDNSRFYVIVFSLTLSVLLLAYLRLTITNDQLLLIRLQQTFGFACLIYWYVALIISPLSSAVGKDKMKRIEFSRRAIGVSAFYFALLHALIALFGQLGGLAQLQFLPELFKWSLLGGTIALIVLGVMSVTSFDGVVRFMTYRRWKWLHRLVYAAGVLAILHVWMIGTHLAYIEMQLLGFSMLSLLAALESYRIAKRFNETTMKLGRAEVFSIALTLWAIISAALLTTPTLIQNYHSRHTNHAEHSEQ